MRISETTLELYQVVRIVRMEEALRVVKVLKQQTPYTLNSNKSPNLVVTDLADHKLNKKGVQVVLITWIINNYSRVSLRLILKKKMSHHLEELFLNIIKCKISLVLVKELYQCRSNRLICNFRFQCPKLKTIFIKVSLTQLTLILKRHLILHMLPLNSWITLKEIQRSHLIPWC